MSTALLTGLSILIIGDSHLATPNYLIYSLHNELTNQGAAVHTFGVCGTTPGDWVAASPGGKCGGADRVGKEPAKVLGSAAMTIPVKALITKEKPNLVIVVMGDTMAGYINGLSKAWAWQQTTSLTKEIASTNTACAWVGPAWGGLDGKNQYKKTETATKLASEFLSKNVSPCTYIDSTAMSKPGEWANLDGQHLTAQGYKSWGEGIAKAVDKLPIVKK